LQINQVEAENMRCALVIDSDMGHSHTRAACLQAYQAEIQAQHHTTLELEPPHQEQEMTDSHTWA
jgi:hypothetical protein